MALFEDLGHHRGALVLRSLPEVIAEYANRSKAGMIRLVGLPVVTEIL
jgi:hypothetical protein